MPTNPVVAIDTTKGDLGAKVELVTGTTSYRVTVPANVAVPIDLTLKSDNLTDSTFKIDVKRPSTQAEASVSAGFERFFSLSDFGYSDIESTPINSVIITIPDPNVGYLMLAQTGFEIDGATNLTNRSTQPAGATVREVSVTRDEIESGKVFFAALPDAVGRNAELEFNVSDGALKSTIPGLFTVSVQGAPKSLDDSIKDAQFTRSFEAEIGEGRFKSIDVALTSAGLTRDEALREIRGLQEDRMISKNLR